MNRIIVISLLLIGFFAASFQAQAVLISLAVLLFLILIPFAVIPWVLIWRERRGTLSAEERKIIREGRAAYAAAQASSRPASIAAHES
jgi:hypothetical protein